MCCKRLKPAFVGWCCPLSKEFKRRPAKYRYLSWTCGVTNFVVYGDVNNLLGFGVSRVTSSFLSKLYWHSLWDDVQKAERCWFLNPTSISVILHNLVQFLYISISCSRDILLTGTSYIDCEKQDRSVREYRLINLNEKFWITLRILWHELFLVYNLVCNLLF
jgi:hypothetical protein